MAQESIQSIQGMKDVLPLEAERWQWLEGIANQWLRDYGYKNIRTPIVENTRLFTRAIGEVTDIVEKEMYSFTDSLNGEALTLRPEGTAACLRAVIQHGLLMEQGPQRLWYSGPMFRHERPQKGRYRQFHQIGVEALGFSGPDIDAEQLLMTADLWQRLGVRNLTLQINSLGSSADRSAHRTQLIAYLEQYRDQLDADGQRRLHSNPLRVLDTKNPAMQTIVEGAPKLWDHLSEASLNHFHGVERLLHAAGIRYEINHRLVRGLDYYNYTVFEWVTTELGAQGTVCAGGRYDGLIEQLGGRTTPACGFGMGLERLLLLLEAQQQLVTPPSADVYLISSGGEATLTYAFTLAQTLRRQGLAVIQHCGGGSFKNQFKKADGSGARFAVIVGDNEAQQNLLAVKHLAAQEQRTLALEPALAWIKEYQSINHNA